MICALIAGVFTGYPVAFLLCGLGVLFAVMSGIPLGFMGTIVSKIYAGILSNWLLLAAPLFIYMGLMLDKSGLAQRLLLTLERLCGQLPGGLALSVAVLGIVMAASTGIVGASVMLLGVIALPVMLRQGYDKKFAAGVTAATGTLGILIPPSIMLVFMGAILQVSIGDLFKAALFPGLMLGTLYILYILGVGFFTPHRAPVPSLKALDDVNKGHSDSLMLELVKNLLGPLLLIGAVLGSIITGIATPTEAAGIGAAGATLLAWITRKLNFPVLRDVVRDTSKTTAMVIFVMIGAACFSAVFKRLGGDTMIEEMFLGTGFGPYGLLVLMMGLIFIMGFFLEWIEISFIVLPLFAPIIKVLDFGFDSTGTELLVWFAILAAMNMQTSFITPPFGYSLFYLRGVAPKGVTIQDIYKSSIPFVILQLICLALIVAFPSIVLWITRI
ncbi:TRAP transporter large permease subunit [Marinobacterium rhizophilum]|uniref:TRAP transporter large permease protein n=2 Tax=Marinobacterium rhizophilum TaxID=420402 RepID=A0ABY5HTF4_9GAMM|nr:TRAP transporter large permease subunit [Marinobacterium rhizophilum]